MRKLLSFLFIFLQIACVAAIGSSLTIPYSFTPNTLIQSAQMNANFSTVASLINGNLDNSNLSSSANINPSKLNLTVPYLNLAAAAATLGFGVGQGTDTVARGGIYGDGSYRLGPGGSTAADIGLQRSAANTVQVFVPGGGTAKLDLTGVSVLGSSSATALAEGRLTLSSSLPVPTSDLTSQGTIYYLPYAGTKISLWDSTHSVIVTDDISTSGINLNLVGSSGMYDVIISDPTGSGTAAISLTAWTNSTTRATNLAYGSHLGVLTLSGTEASRYMGSIFLTGTNSSEDTAGDRCVFNYYNRVPRYLFAQVPVSSWTYSTATLRASDANTTNAQGRFSFVNGVNEGAIQAQFVSQTTTASLAGSAQNAIGVDSTTAAVNGVVSVQAASNAGTNTITYSAQSAIGYHFIQMLEAPTAAIAATFFGTASGMNGVIMQ